MKIRKSLLYGFIAIALVFSLVFGFGLRNRVQTAHADSTTQEQTTTGEEKELSSSDNAKIIFAGVGAIVILGSCVFCAYYFLIKKRKTAKQAK